MTKEQVNTLAMSLNFPFDHSKNEVQDLERLEQLVNLALDAVIYTRLSEAVKDAK